MSLEFEDTCPYINSLRNSLLDDIDTIVEKQIKPLIKKFTEELRDMNSAMREKADEQIDGLEKDVDDLRKEMEQATND